MNKSRSLLPFLLIVIAFLAIILQLRFSWHQYHNQGSLLAEQHLVALDVAYRSSVDMYRLDVETRFHAITQRTEVLELLHRAQQASEEELPLIRGLLYRQLVNEYREMVAVGLRQLHFHLPDGRTLLRFHRPEWLGDGLYELRPSVRMSHSQRQVISGFEHGRSLPAFRNVFPITDGQTFLGSVEISLPFERIHDNLLTLLPAGDYALLLNRELLLRTLEPELHIKFIEASLHPDYLQEHPEISRVSRDFIESPKAQLLGQYLRSDARVQQALSSGEAFAHPFIHHEQGYVASFFPVRDLKDEHAAYLVAYIDAPLLLILRYTTFREGIVMAMLFLLLALSVWQLYRKHGRLLVELQRQRQIEDELQRSNAELEQFSYAISHDMRQPLRMISGHVQLLERSMKGRLDDDERESMHFAIDGARRMDNMIVSLLNYSRVGRKTDPMAWLSSREVMDEALSFLAPAITESAAKIEINGGWPRLYASRDELSRLLQNLIGNAIKYRMPDTAPELHIDAALSAQNWRVMICDKGVGIPPDQQTRLFQVFSRLHAHQGFEGSGVGLALCRKIVEHHGGRIGVNSAGVGEGSCFWFELPLHDEGGR